MLFNFQVGVTILYIYLRAGPNVDRAIRDITSTVAILADRSEKADMYVRSVTSPFRLGVSEALYSQVCS